MKFAIVEEDRREAEPGLSAVCPVCGDPMIAKCGQHRVWHWAHRGIRVCDHWWESETEWHRAWKNQFPKDWQERIHTSKDGEKHIADVKTERGIVLEFQHSFLKVEERESRELFYQNMAWIVNGRRRALDRARFFALLGAAVVVNRTPLIVLMPTDASALLRDWKVSRVPVYFDFGDSEPSDGLRFDHPVLWRLSPSKPNGRAYLSPMSKGSFLDAHLAGEPFEEMYTTVVERAAANYYLMLTRQVRHSLPLTGFERYMARRRSRRL